MISKTLKVSLFFSCYLIWLALCFALAVAGLLLPKKALPLKSKTVQESETICKTLYQKGKLSAEEYDFETHQVAETYDDLVFKGYEFIVAPVIWMLKRGKSIDSLVLFFVYRWMNVHHCILGTTETENSSQITAPKFDIKLTKICVALAKGTGKSLSLFD